MHVNDSSHCTQIHPWKEGSLSLRSLKNISKENKKCGARFRGGGMNIRPVSVTVTVETVTVTKGYTNKMGLTCLFPQYKSHQTVLMADTGSPKKIFPQIPPDLKMLTMSSSMIFWMSMLRLFCHALFCALCSLMSEQLDRWH